MAKENPKIKKDSKSVVILTLYEKIVGEVHGIPNSRVLDTLNNRSDKFIAVSNAEVYQKIDGKLLYRTAFLSLNIEHVLLVSEQTEFL